MKEEKNVTPIVTKSWSNPSIGGNVSSIETDNRKEIDELKLEIEELKKEISRLTNEEPTVVEPVNVDIPEIKEEVPFESPFTEDVMEQNEVKEDTSKEIIESVKEEVIEEPVKEVTPMVDIPLESEKEKVSVVINRYNNDLVASTKGKGAKFITLSDGEQNKLLSGKINEIN
jgi:hypothetical protein